MVVQQCYFFSMVVLTQFWTAQLADLEFGHAQVEQVICDRPEMGEVINRELALRARLELGFSGLACGHRVYWDRREPPMQQSANYPAHGNDPNRVRLTNKPTLSTVDKCTLLVFELENARQSRRYAALGNMARKRQMSREDFARSSLHLEYESAKRTRDFFREHPLKQQPGEGNRQYNALLMLPDDYSLYLTALERQPESEHNPLQHYREWHDGLRSPRKTQEPAGAAQSTNAPE
jgi:hypothetical protein